MCAFVCEEGDLVRLGWSHALGVHTQAHFGVCAYSTLIENKGLIQSGTMTYTQHCYTLNKYMLQIKTMERQCTQA